jgi:hypothetical protein
MATSAIPREQRSSASFLLRLWRVARQLILLGVSAAVYYALMTWLLDRFGGQGFLYALLVLAGAMALLREFGPDLKGMPGRIREALRRPPKPKTEAPAAETVDPSAPPLTAEPANRTDAEALFRQQSDRRDQGKLTEEAFETFAKGFYFVDEHGKFWTIQADTGKWAYFQGGEWHAGLPLGTLSKAQGSG